MENSANGIDWFERVESDLASAAYTDHQTEISEGTLTQAQLDAKISSNKIKGISLESSSTDNHVVYGTNNTQIHYKWYAGVMQAGYDKDNNGTVDYTRYYAVQQIPVVGNNNVLQEVTFKNTRIGVVNLRVGFNWNLGDTVVNNIAIKVYADYSDGNGLIPVKVDGSEEIVIPVTSDLEEYYLLNMPKYTKNGIIIKYTVSEVKINGNTVDLDDMTCDINGNNCNVNIGYEDYINNNSSNSGDIIPLTISNTFADSTTCTVNKLWKDDTNALNKRTDLIIRLYQHSTNTRTPVAQDIQIGKDYHWIKSETDTENNWHYTYEDLPQYDAQGYEYIYYVKELTDKLWKNEYVTDYIAADDADDAAENTRVVHKYYNDNTYKGRVIYEETESGDFEVANDVRAFNGETIINKLEANTEINGDKLWQNISSEMLNVDYPIADIFLYGSKKRSENTPGYKTVNAPADKGGYALMYSETKKGKEYNTELVNSVKIFCGANNFTFTQSGELPKKLVTEEQTKKYDLDDTAVQYGVVYEGRTYDDDVNFGSTLGEIPKYDENGALIDYSLEERAINGYTFKISDQKVINEYSGGDSVRITFNKNWLNMTNRFDNYPKIRVTLHQAYIGSSDSAGTTKVLKDYATFEKIFGEDDYRAAGDGNVQYIFGDSGHPKENLREYAPDGTKFYYYFTEQLIALEG